MNKHVSINSLDELYKAFDGLSMEGGWHRRKPALWAQPAKNFLPAIWRWNDVRPVLDAAGRLVSTEFAERRNLTMTNPVEGNLYPTVRTIVAAYQMMRPGEIAKAHRHTPNALRLALRGRGTYTVVDGVRTTMGPGDVVLTPGGTWHSHGIEGNEDCYWLDFLDVPLVHLLEPMFFEHHPDGLEKSVTHVEDPPLAFRWEATQRSLDAVGPDPTNASASQIELGSPALKTIALYMQRFSPGVRTSTVQTTANNIFAVAEGSGTTYIDGEPLQWSFGDVIAVPAWRAYSHEAKERSHLLRVTDEPVFRSLGFLREQFA